MIWPPNNFSSNSEIIFDLSVIIPFYKKLDAFSKVLPNNAYHFSRSGLEVIIVMDESSEEGQLLDLIGQYPEINWKVIVNDSFHAWRPPCKALNVGIRNSEHNFILFLDPESELIGDLIGKLYNIAISYLNSYSFGNVIYSDFSKSITEIKNSKYESLKYGSILVPRSILEALHGYDESYSQWGGDDDNFRARLDHFGLRGMYVADALAIHREFNSIGHDTRYIKHNQLSYEKWKQSYYPDNYFANDENWGTDFCRIANYKK